MARTTFGGTLADYVVLPESGVYRRPGSVEVTVWSAQTGGTQLTDLLLGGNPVTSLRTGSEGLIPAFQGPDGVTEAWYQVAGASQRVRIATGPQGPAGTPGADGAPGGSDEAMAAWVADEDSLTREALSAADGPIAAVVPLAAADKGGRRLAGMLAAPVGSARRDAQMMAVATRSATWNLSDNNGNPDPIPWNTERLDTGGIHSTSTNTSRMTVPPGGGGIWKGRVAIPFPVNTTGVREVFVRQTYAQSGGTSIITPRTSIQAASLGRFHVMQVDIPPTPMRAGDYLEVQYFQNSGGTLVMDPSGAFFQIERVGDFRNSWESVTFSADTDYRGSWEKYVQTGGSTIEGIGLTVAPDPVNPERLCGKIRCTQDNDSVLYPRVQAATAANISRTTGDVYIGLSVLIPQETHDALTAAGHGLNIHEIYGPPSGTRSPNLLQYNPTVGLNLNAWIGGADARLWTLAPADCVGRWVDIVHRVRLNDDPAVGFHELWADWTGVGIQPQTLSYGGQTGTRFYLSTVLPGVNDGGNNYSSLKVSWANGSSLEEASIYIGEHRLGGSLWVATERAQYSHAY